MTKPADFPYSQERYDDVLSMRARMSASNATIFDPTFVEWAMDPDVQVIVFDNRYHTWFPFEK